MTARRQPRISDVPNDAGFEDDDSSPDRDLRDFRRSVILGYPSTNSPTKFSFPHSDTAIHPSLTNYGPESAARYFREALEKLKVNAVEEGKGKGKMKDEINTCHQSEHRQAYQRNIGKVFKTVFDESSDNDTGLDDSGKDEDDVSRRGDGRSSSDDEFWPDMADSPFPLSSRRDRLRLPRLAKSSPRKTRPVQPSIPSARVDSDLPLGARDATQSAGNPQTRPSTSLKAERKRSIFDPEDAIQSIEGDIDTGPASITPDCGHELLCLCEPIPSTKTAGVELPTTDLSTKPARFRKPVLSPVKSQHGRRQGSPSKKKGVTSPVRRTSATARLSSTLGHLTSSRRRAKDFEDHASEKRRSWRPGGDEVLQDEELNMSEPELTKIGSDLAFSPPAITGSDRQRRRLAQTQSWSATFGETIERGASNVINETTTQGTTVSIAQALNGLTEEGSTGLLGNWGSLFQPQKQPRARRRERPTASSLAVGNDSDEIVSVSLDPRPLTEDSDDADVDAGAGINAHSSRRHARRALARQYIDLPSIGSVSRNENGDAGRGGPRLLRHRASLSATWTNAGNSRTSQAVSTFDYNAITPQQLPKDFLRRPARSRHNYTNRRNVAGGLSDRRSIRRGRQPGRSNARTTRPDAGNDINIHAAQGIETSELEHWDPSPLQGYPNDPPICSLGKDGQGWPEGLPVDIFMLITQYLSHQDVRNLRSINSYFESVLGPVIFRNVVTKFGKSLFDVNNAKWERKPPKDSVFEKYGMEMSKFGIAFEVDLEGLQSARPKVIQDQQHSWWGKYTWPVPIYPRFKPLEELENLADHLLLLRGAFEELTNVSELGLSLDSGHGWLNGPDMSDMAVWNTRGSKGSKIFGKTFHAEDKWDRYGRNELFKWAQANSINEAIKSLRSGADSEQWGPESRFLNAVAIRDFDSYVSRFQPDADPEAHTGGTVPTTNPAVFNQQHQQNFQQAVIGPNWAWQLPVPPQNHGAPGVGQHHLNFPPMPMPTNANAAARAIRRGAFDLAGRQNVRTKVKKGETIHPQWPIIYNGYNLAAEIGGHCTFVQNKLADPRTFPLLPGQLTEAQAQWLMETVWAQRAFLSAYTTAILTHKANFKHVHSLHIAKISSGLLPSLEQREFWQALPSLRTLKVLVSPDWRTEYTPGDQAFQNNMLISPVQASIKFANFLQRYVARIEHLCTLTIGFFGGGEHATGLFARNQHVLPAPITFDPRSWLSDHVAKPNLDTMIAFNHIKNLTIENAWLSPFMLEGFMSRSRDTSLRQLTLDSVSLTSVNSQRTNQPLTTFEDGLKPVYHPAAWLQERLPTEHCWPALIDRLTPGVTFSELKHSAGLVDLLLAEPPERSFRGNVEKLSFKSCGYARISGVPPTELNQNELVVPNANPRDHGLTARENLMREARGLGEAYGNATANVMMRDKDAQGNEWFGLGRLTQCIHPIEKRILEQAWRMKFGWGNNVDRFAAVEDGCFEGGTGRFSGDVAK